MFKIGITNMENHNCEIIDLPTTKENIVEKIDIISIHGTDEVYISSFYCPELPNLVIDEFADIYRVNEFAKELEEFEDDSYYTKWLNAYLEYGIYDILYAIQTFQDESEFYEDTCIKDYAMEMADELIACCSISKSIPDFLYTYFDYNAFCRDFEIETNYYENDDGLLIMC